MQVIGEKLIAYFTEKSVHHECMSVQNAGIHRFPAVFAYQPLRHGNGYVRKFGCLHRQCIKRHSDSRCYDNAGKRVFCIDDSERSGSTEVDNHKRPVIASQSRNRICDDIRPKLRLAVDFNIEPGFNSRSDFERSDSEQRPPGLQMKPQS